MRRVQAQKLSNKYQCGRRHAQAEAEKILQQRAQTYGSQDTAEIRFNRPVAQMAEHRSPKPKVGGSIPSWPGFGAGFDNVGTK